MWFNNTVEAYNTLIPRMNLNLILNVMIDNYGLLLVKYMHLFFVNTKQHQMWVNNTVEAYNTLLPRMNLNLILNVMIDNYGLLLVKHMYLFFG